MAVVGVVRHDAVGCAAFTCMFRTKAAGTGHGARGGLQAAAPWTHSTFDVEFIFGHRVFRHLLPSPTFS